MFTFSQWLHQHEILLACAALVLFVTVILILRWRSIWMWLVWFAISGMSVGALMVLRTPAATVSEYRGPETEHISYEGLNVQSITFAYSEPAPKSVEEIEKLVGQVGKPTLLEIYADYGFS
ncbi:MAG TPA: hypothetical protein VKS79_04530 [Gemmataceae bacterium]|nr:hypothetical protein [Gemmataceae bacterium]